MAVINNIKASKEGLLQYIAACPLLLAFFLSPFITNAIAFYILFFTRFYPLVLLYILWMIIDNETCYKDGRRCHWVRNLQLWSYFRDYFPQKLVKTAELPPENNYMLCVFPHGIFCSSAFAHFTNDSSDFYKFFPDLSISCHTLNCNFYMPLSREYVLGLGFTSVSRESILHQLNKGKGHASVIFVGGSAEAMKSSLGQYRLVLKNRKGFVKLCLITGTFLVPTFVFREVDIYDQWMFSKKTLIRKGQELWRKIMGVGPCLFLGTGFLGLSPHKVPVTTVVGKPIPVTKIENPTPEDINNLHQLFIKELTSLFEEHKSKYIEKSEGIHLSIEDS